MNGTDISRLVYDLYCSPWYWSELKTAGEAVEAKTNLIFSGWGGDEFISVNDRGIEQDLLRGLNLRTFFRRNPVKPFRKFVRDQLIYVIRPALGILDRGTKRSFRDDARYIKKPFRMSDRRSLRNFYFHTSRRQLHLRMLIFYHLQERCESWAVMGFREGVEYRYPLLDKRIIEYIIKVPSEILCKTDYYRPLLREIGEGILHEDVRLHFDKNDPVYWSWMAELFRESAISFMDETGDWKNNPDLHFVNFELLSEDIGKYKESSDSVDNRVLFKALVYLKWMDEFTKRYNAGNGQVISNQ
jgi:hypothetical protein